jgi:hypothetical protein
MPTIVPALLAAMAAKIGDPLEFYVVVATVIPVLFIAIGLEAKLLDVVLGELWELAFAALIPSAAIIGEIVALKVLITQHPSEPARDAVIASLVVLGFGLITATIVPGRWPKRWQRLLAVMPPTVFGAALTWVLLH